MNLSFVNHASVKIYADGIAILCDPWLEGSAFFDGWDLLIRTPMTSDEVMKDVTHIWISHEHPDHFSPRFLAQVAQRHPEVVVLMQRTRDGRMKSFCQSKGLRVLELDDRVPTNLSPRVRITVGTHEFYDSWLHVTDGERSVLNLNDCGIDDPDVLAALRRDLGAPDVLLSQFSYAAWKGGRDHRAFRAHAAARKLRVLATQSEALGAAYVLPFASFVYFSHEENAFMNDGINDVDDAVGAIKTGGALPLVLYPGDAWEVGGAHDPEPARARYREAYRALPELPRHKAGPSVPLERLAASFLAWRARCLVENDRRTLWMLRRVPGRAALGPVRVRLHDLDLTVAVGLFDGFAIVDDGPFDASMHSSSLQFVFAQTFGFDTLTVNGRFEADAAGFSRMTRSFALGSLNGMGLRIGPSLAKDAWVVALLLRKLRTVAGRLAAGSEGGRRAA